VKKTAVSILVVLAAVAPFLPGRAAEVPPEVRAKAAGLIAALDKIEAEGRPYSPARGAAPAPAPGSRSLTFSEPEFNAYLACRLADENEPNVKAAEFKLLAANKFEGHITLDLGKPQASGLLPQKQDLLFAGRFETSDGKIRIDLASLFLGTQPIAPAFVDVIIEVVSRLQGVKPTSLKDWYDLPLGVLRLETKPGQVVVIY
jgi:hypothetical protein